MIRPAPAVRSAASAVGRVAGVAAAVTVLTFLLVHLIPGDAATALLGSRATPQAVAEVRSELGLDLPVVEQLVRFVTTVATQGDTGDSLVNGVSARELVVTRAPLTLGLVALAALFAVAAAVPLALVAALRRGRLADHLVRVVTTVGIALPAFWAGLLLIALFAVNLGWFPVGGVRAGLPRSLVLPAVTAALPIVPVLVRSLRLQLLQTLTSDWVAALHAAGLPPRRVVVHVLRASALPALVLVGMNVAYLVGGAVVVENVFALPGVGDLMFDAIGTRDLPVVQAVVLYSAFGVIVVTTLTDLLTRVLDPRTRVAARPATETVGAP